MFKIETIRPAPAEHNALTRRSIGPIVSEIRKNDEMFKLISCEYLRNNSGFGAALPAEHNALTQQVDWPNSFWDMQKCLKSYFCNWRNNSGFGAALPAEHNALTLRSLGPIVVWDLQMFKSYFCELKKQQFAYRQKLLRYLPECQRVDTAGRLAQYCFFRYAKMFKILFHAYLKKQQCIRRNRYLLSTTRCAQQVAIAPNTVVSSDMQK